MAHCRSPRRVGALSVLVGLLLVAAGCSSSQSSARPTPSTVATTTSSTIPGQEPSSGCTHAAASPPPRGDVAHTITSGGVVHHYLLSVPASYKPGVPTPVVLAFHGFGSFDAEFANLTRMPQQGSARGYIVMTPDGPGHTWKLDGKGVDAAFVDDIVATLSKSFCIDLHRVYAAGFSQGAAFAIIYSCARPGRIAALATVAVDFLLGCKQAVPYLAFHGTDDPLVPYRNGAIGGSIPGVKVRGTLLNLGDWARLDGCNPTPKTQRVGTEIVRAAWKPCAAGSEVELYTIEHGSHTWPGADPAASPLYTTRQINATTLMLGFFRRHHVAGS